MSIWRRSSLVFIYLLLVVVSSWLYEWFLLYENGFTTYQIVDPLRNLTVSQLQALLDGRGIQYTTLLEKQEIIEVLQCSGSVQYMELLTAVGKPVTNGPNEIVGKDEFYEQVLEENESIWVIEVIPGEGQYTGQRLLDESSWLELDVRLNLIGINTAVIRCYKDPNLCARQGWTHPQLVMAIPKPDSIGKKYFHLPSTTHLSVNTVMNWIHKELTEMITKIQTPEELENIWLNTTVVKEKKIPQMVLFTELLNPPLLLVTLGLRFSSRIRIAIYHIGRSEKDQVMKTLHKHKLNMPPSLVVTSADNLSIYGNKKGETLTVTALDIYIRLLQPRMNDLFLISLVLTNLLAFVDFLDVRGSVWRHVARTLFIIPIHNVLVFISWLSLTAVMKFTWTGPIFDAGVWLIYKLNSIKIAETLLYHLIVVGSFLDVSLTALFLFLILIYCWRSIMGRSVQSNQDPTSESWYTVFPMDSYLVNVLFRPMASLSRPRPSHDFDLEEGMERLIQRLATPDLWLHPVLPTEYIKDLPSWRYDGWGNEDDLKSESETDFDSLSENENDKLLELHTCCQDEGCKMCTLWATVKETYVCHRCAILKRKLEKKYLRFRDSGDSVHQNYTYEKLLRVCENCSRTKKNLTSTLSEDIHLNEKKRQWFLSAQRLHELKWTAPKHAIESRVCAICLDKYRWSAVLCGLPCGHTYHHSCIMEWLTKDNHQCPTCRWPSYKTKVFNVPYISN